MTLKTKIYATWYDNANLSLVFVLLLFVQEG
jgi:hypothetical protein